MRKHSSGAEVFRITGARTSLSADVRGRQRRYVISMGIRTLCILLAIALWDVSRPFAWAALVGGALLPYIAVVIANAGRENAVNLPSSLLPPESRPELERPSHPSDDEEPH